jgi:metal-sulfur cluster biosynthetic enzyme
VLSENGQRLDVHALQAVQSDALDELADLRLGAAHVQLRAPRPQPAREHRDVQKEGGVGERQLGEIDDDVGPAHERARECAAAARLRRPYLVAAAAKYRRVVVELDDPGKLPDGPGGKSRPLIPESYTRTMPSVDDVEAALSNVIDPELGLDFVELGLIYGIEVEGGDVHVTFTLTSPGCPIGPQVSEQIEEFVSEVDGVTSVESSMTFSPPWTPDRMTEDAKFALGF